MLERPALVVRAHAPDLYVVRKRMRQIIYDLIIRDSKHCRRVCVACNGSGHYDHDGAPPCGECSGSGRSSYLDRRNARLVRTHPGLTHALLEELERLYALLGDGWLRVLGQTYTLKDVRQEVWRAQ